MKGIDSFCECFEERLVAVLWASWASWVSWASWPSWPLWASWAACTHKFRENSENCELFVCVMFPNVNKHSVTDHIQNPKGWF